MNEKHEQSAGEWDMKVFSKQQNSCEVRGRIHRTPLGQLVCKESQKWCNMHDCPEKPAAREPVAVAGEWKCPSCGYGNMAFRLTCVECGHTSTSPKLPEFCIECRGLQQDNDRLQRELADAKQETKKLRAEAEESDDRESILSRRLAILRKESGATDQADKIIQVSGFGVENTLSTQCNYMLCAVTASGRVLMSMGDREWVDASPKLARIKQAMEE